MTDTKNSSWGNLPEFKPFDISDQTTSLSQTTTSPPWSSIANTSQPIPHTPIASHIPLPPNLSPTKLFVGCLPYSKTTSDISALFGQYGPLLEVILLSNPEGKSKGAAFVTFAYEDDALNALSSLVDFSFNNSTRSINVSLATKQNYHYHSNKSNRHYTYDTQNYIYPPPPPIYPPPRLPSNSSSFKELNYNRQYSPQQQPQEEINYYQQYKNNSTAPTINKDFFSYMLNNPASPPPLPHSNPSHSPSLSSIDQCHYGVNYPSPSIMYSPNQSFTPPLTFPPSPLPSPFSPSHSLSSLTPDDYDTIQTFIMNNQNTTPLINLNSSASDNFNQQEYQQQQYIHIPHHNHPSFSPQPSTYSSITQSPFYPYSPTLAPSPLHTHTRTPSPTLTHASPTHSHISSNSNEESSSLEQSIRMIESLISQYSHPSPPLPPLLPTTIPPNPPNPSNPYRLEFIDTHPPPTKNDNPCLLNEINSSLFSSTPSTSMTKIINLPN